MTVGKKIKRLRLKHEMTQEDLATKIHVTRNAVSKWETDKGLPNIDSLMLLSKLFDVSLDYFFGTEELIKTTIENKKTVELNKNLLYSIILFIAFAIIGTFIPYYFFTLEPDSVMVVLLIILPMTYLLLGVVSVLSLSRLGYVSITAALALVPIYVFFDLYLPEISLGLWGLIYYLIYVGTFILISKIVNRNISKTKADKLKKLFIRLFVITCGGFILHTVYEVIDLLNCTLCSAPWHVALIINIVIYIIPLTILMTLVIYYHKKSRLEVNK